MRWPLLVAGSLVLAYSMRKKSSPINGDLTRNVYGAGAPTPLGGLSGSTALGTDSRLRVSPLPAAPSSINFL